MNFKPGDRVLISTNISRTNKYFGENREKSTYAGQIKRVYGITSKKYLSKTINGVQIERDTPKKERIPAYKFNKYWTFFEGDVNLCNVEKIEQNIEPQLFDIKNLL